MGTEDRSLSTHTPGRGTPLAAPLNSHATTQRPQDDPVPLNLRVAVFRAVPEGQALGGKKPCVCVPHPQVLSSARSPVHTESQGERTTMLPDVTDGQSGLGADLTPGPSEPGPAGTGRPQGGPVPLLPLLDPCLGGSVDPVPPWLPVCGRKGTWNSTLKPEREGPAGAGTGPCLTPPTNQPHLSHLKPSPFTKLGINHVTELENKSLRNPRTGGGQWYSLAKVGPANRRCQSLHAPDRLWARRADRSRLARKGAQGTAHLRLCSTCMSLVSLNSCDPVHPSACDRRGN